jgi:hypothetical protein
MSRVLPQPPEDILDGGIDFVGASRGRQGTGDDRVHRRRPSVEQLR